MTEEQLNNIQEELTTKLGNDKFAEIADTWGKITTYTTEGNEKHAKLQADYSSLKKTNEALITSNGNLLKQIPREGVVSMDNQSSTDEVAEHKYSFKGGLDEKGNFKR